MLWRDKEIDWTGVIMMAVALVAVIVGLGLLIIRPIDKTTNIRTIEGTVTEKTTKRVGRTDRYIVFIQDESGEIVTLEVTDAWLRGRFDSSDVYGGIEVGKTYAFEVGGSRRPILSWYPNIYSYQEIE